MRKLSYDRLAMDGCFFRELTFDEFMDRALEHLQSQPCTHDGKCLHCAAASIESIKRIVEHDPNCPECAELTRKREEG